MKRPPKFHRKGKGRRVPGVMNTSEAKFASEVLDEMVKRGEIQWWMYEPMALKLGARTTYTPDFLVMTKDGYLEFYEFKGFWMDAARVKIKVAASKYHFLKFTVVTKKAGKYEYEEIKTDTP